MSGINNISQFGAQMEGFKEAVLARLEILNAGIASFTESTNAKLDAFSESIDTKMDAQNSKYNILIWMIGLFGGSILLILVYATFFAEQ